ncbi:MULTISPECIES: molybdenum ABC transporter ATP-binding protein [Methylosinus]|uniref:Molybdenum ABC transporter ATP-binding protein n=1 Tax=Methylosinus trichosporium (strain ATCC 35070 / NCIMB 11131 / UNIQEM 75 / OB3b) TaxID=595536 RepID=A0A2D2D313_METT3|nr:MULTISPECIES: molybdenum ABC transporter ATP-binding protein [Methylosinus]ATQ69355.1 molybdenum ABC transporter ATP-binding protein [Methylosinus trichosporium OB3b]OBS52871.1 molybdenum ABC transporter ATP-binding protein [Methylosinus sp. 3S-1]
MIAVDGLRLRRGDFTLTASFASKARILALYGPSGSGKTSLAHLVAGLAAPDAGRIAVNGATLVDRATRLFVPPEKRRISLVFQDALLFPHLDVKTNILFGRFFTPVAERRVPFDSVVETLGVAHLLRRRPGTLSGGERQRVGLARALLCSPRLLVMDEPMASLDFDRRQEIMALIERLRDEFAIPILLVSHAADEILRLADEVVALERGRIVAQGLPSETIAAASRAVEGGRFSVVSALRAQAGVFDSRYGVTRLAHPAGEIVVAARVADGERPVRALIKATDVALARRRPSESSIRTMLEGVIRAIDEDEGPLAFVQIAMTGGDVLTASVTRLSVAEMNLTVGGPVFALVKSVALDERELGAGMARD